jgi:nicotinate-nucleotide pyrophosphorylase (carboxylating)
VHRLEGLVHDALAEDIGQGDITTEATVPEDRRCRARLMAKQAGLLSGMLAFRKVFELLEAELDEWDGLEDRARFEAGTQIASFKGLARPILTGERVALNYLQHLSGIATMTARFVEATQGLTVRICDTRKTVPLMRPLERLAVVHGGGSNHRFALFDGVLIKENHIAASGGIAVAVERAVASTHHLLKIGVEVRDL